MQRRFFLKQSGLLAAGAGFSRFIPVAGPFTANDFSPNGVPHDKKFDPAWVRSLYERGQATVYRKSRQELRYIGMPVGGICCGNVYLGGDGRLWLWDVFNKNQAGAIPKILPIKLEGFNINEISNTCGTLYLEPAVQESPFQQGFALILRQPAGKQHNGDWKAGETIVKRLQHEDWDEIEFEATYPVATIRYSQKGLPVVVEVKAFSPFIPGDELNSGLPVTVQSIEVKNLSDKEIEASVVGWVENRILPETAKKQKDFSRSNQPLGPLKPAGWPKAGGGSKGGDGPREAGLSGAHYKRASYEGLSLQASSDHAEIRQAADFGTLAFVSLSGTTRCYASLEDVRKAAPKQDGSLPSGPDPGLLSGFLKEEENAPIAILSRSFKVPAAGSITSDFAIAWHMPNLVLGAIPDRGRYYTVHFEDAAAVANYVAGKYTWLRQKTMLWHTTWYDSTLPWWFLERTFANTSILATTTTHRLSSGRFYAWEGVGCCEGTCTHVWQYAQAAGRVFPALERDTRQRVDLGISLLPDGGMGFRGEANMHPAIDGQAGTILRFYREHQMSANDGFLKNNWDNIKKTVVFLLAQDKNKDGMEDTPLENTLDAVWKGEISWIVGLCIAAARAGEEMAAEMKDVEFARTCREYVEKGRRNMEQYLFNGEYFIHRPDPVAGRKSIGSYNTCHIDQVYGQSWAWQVGLGRVLDKDKTVSALRALWKYNYKPDVGPYIKDHPGGRFYALAGDGGMVMNTNPLKEEKPYGEDAKAWQLGYFSECMSGFEHQVAAHMMAEGMTEEALILTKSIHDRYHAYKRNPFNEIECSDHYARAMASYGTFISACGFTYHGPRGHIGFAPRLGSDFFKAPFTAAEGWGSYRQERKAGKNLHRIEVKHGSLSLRSVAVAVPAGMKPDGVVITLDGKAVRNSHQMTGGEWVFRVSGGVAGAAAASAKAGGSIAPGGTAAGGDEGIRIGEGQALEIRFNG
ncbi:MAG: GH116 family glycosyl-hydrolase [Puia sp.]|nr:GH116 family glycosyl-hydrolase [Puia sp.]